MPVLYIWLFLKLINLPLQVLSFNPSTCNYTEYISLSERMYFYSPNYPKEYSFGTSCEWAFSTEYNNQIIVSCDEIDIPTSPGCHQDRLSISLTGDRNFKDAKNYCGKGQLSLVSVKNQLIVGLFAAWYSRGGKILCSVTSILNKYPPPPPNPNPYCDCGWKQEGKIVGGNETSLHEFPFMSALFDTSNYDLLCGASIIATKYAITAAHCLNKKQPSQLQLLVGDHNIETTSETESARYAISRFIVHENYSTATSENDIAIVVTTLPIYFNENIGPVCLPFRYSNYDFINFPVIALGWGTLEFTGVLSSTLQKVVLNVVSNQYCSTRLSGINQIFAGQICTYERNKDTCQYDSGGPIVWYNATVRRLQLVGIISFGVACATDYPSVNTRITSYLAWIVSETTNTDYCFI